MKSKSYKKSVIGASLGEPHIDAKAAIFSILLDVRMEKEQKQELGWRVSVLPIPAFHCILCTCNTL